MPYSLRFFLFWVVRRSGRGVDRDFLVFSDLTPVDDQLIYNHVPLQFPPILTVFSPWRIRPRETGLESYEKMCNLSWSLDILHGYRSKVQIFKTKVAGTHTGLVTYKISYGPNKIMRLFNLFVTNSVFQMKELRTSQIISWNVWENPFSK